MDNAKKNDLVRILLKKKVPQVSHLEQMKTNIHGRKKSLVF